MDTQPDSPTPVEHEVIELGDVADLTLGQGRARNENKRSPYN
ncbi:albusnodin family lasso peptide [Nocardiopsis sp. NPDC049922]